MSLRKKSEFNKTDDKKIINYQIPLEGKLMSYFASNLILVKDYDKAIRVLNEFGISHHFEGKRGYINKLNLRKLLALAYYKSD